MVPECISTMALLITRPSPSPSLFESACSKALKILPTNCGSMPMPLSNLAAHVLQRRLQELMRVGLTQLQRQLSARDAGETEQIFDQAHLKFEITADHF